MDEKQINTLYNIIGSRISEARKNLRLSQDELADKVSISRTSIVNIEKGRQRLPLHLLWEIGICLNLEPMTFFPAKDEIINQPTSQKIDDKTLDIIEKSAKGNLETRRKLIEFYISAG